MIKEILISDKSLLKLIIKDYKNFGFHKKQIQGL